MNHLSHARLALHDPWLLAGTQLPDWLGACDRRARVCRDLVDEAAASGARPDRALARGVQMHLDDDRWFHGTLAFEEVNRELTQRIRDAFPEHRRLRASFIGHVLLEMLLDAHLMETWPGILDRYYTALHALDVMQVQQRAAALCRSKADRLHVLIQRFRTTEFLRGYVDDEGVVRRLDGLLARVRQPPLPPGFAALVPASRSFVRARAHALLTPPPA